MNIIISLTNTFPIKKIIAVKFGLDGSWLSKKNIGRIHLNESSCHCDEVANPSSPVLYNCSCIKMTTKFFTLSNLEKSWWPDWLTWYHSIMKIVHDSNFNLFANITYIFYSPTKNLKPNEHIFFTILAKLYSNIFPNRQ